MKSSRWIIPAVVALGLLAGAAIVGRPTSIDGDQPLPLDAGATTSTTTAPTTTAATVPPTTTASPDTVPETSAALVNTTTTTTLPDPASVRVVVGNGSNRNGLATDTADELSAAGYVDAIATNAIGDSPDSYIVYREGFQGSAVAVAELLGIPTERVLPYIDADVTERDDDGDVIVVVGADRVD